MADEEYARTMFHGPRVGDVLPLSARTIASNFAPLLAIAALCLGPAMILDVVLFFQTGRTATQIGARELLPDVSWTFYAGAFSVVVVRTILTYVAQGAVMFLTVEHLAGRKSGVGPAMSKATSRALVVIATAILESLLIGLGSVACLFPGIIVACACYVAIPVAVGEKVGPVQALRRSTDMTRGYRWSIFALFVITFVLAFVLAFGMQVARMPFATSTNTAARLVSWGMNWVVELINAVVFSVMAAVTYALLRGVHDGLDAESLASVFA